jgi:hypothetical protein
MTHPALGYKNIKNNTFPFILHQRKIHFQYHFWVDINYKYIYETISPEKVKFRQSWFTVALLAVFVCDGIYNSRIYANRGREKGLIDNDRINAKKASNALLFYFVSLHPPIFL